MYPSDQFFSKLKPDITFELTFCLEHMKYYLLPIITGTYLHTYLESSKLQAVCRNIANDHQIEKFIFNATFSIIMRL